VNSFVRIRTYGMMGSVNIFEKKEKRKLEMAGKEKEKKTKNHRRWRYHHDNYET
jgi:hypothetical protein